jgi:hypothetical protein
MSKILDEYRSLDSKSSHEKVIEVLDAIINAPSSHFDPAARGEQIQLLLDDISSSHQGSNGKGRLTTIDSARALLAIKTLGKDPVGSTRLSSAANLSALLRLSCLKDIEASNEALRCIANAMLLVDGAREVWIRNDVGGRSASVDLLEKSSQPDRIFLASRILFLSTVSSSTAGSYICSLIESKTPHSKSMVDVIGAKLDILRLSILAGTKMAREAMTDLLKFVFNLLLHYPKLAESDVSKQKGNSGSTSPTSERSEADSKQLGEIWNHRLDDLLPPILRVFNTFPPLFPSPMAPPLTHVVHTLIAIPVTDSLRPHWFSHSTFSSAKSTRASTPTSPLASTETAPDPSNSSSGSGRLGSSMDKALSVLSAGRRSLSRSPSPLPQRGSHDTLLRAFDLLEVSLTYYMPDNIDPDHISVRDRARSDGDSSCDDLLSPLVILITRLCVADQDSRKRVREWLVPADLERTSTLEDRADTLGRCLRLLSSVYHERLKTTVGEMLYAIHESDASLLSASVGYGNVAGFLFNKGIMNAPPPPSSNVQAPAIPENLNPITGTYQRERSTELDEMTEEEKEREAEKLFVLFERLERTGALPRDQNPIRKAFQEGKFQGA